MSEARVDDGAGCDQPVRAEAGPHAQRRRNPDGGGRRQADDLAPLSEDHAGAEEPDAGDDSRREPRGVAGPTA